MQYAEHLPTTRNMVAPVLALAIGLPRRSVEHRGFASLLSGGTR